MRPNIATTTSRASAAAAASSLPDVLFLRQNSAEFEASPGNFLLRTSKRGNVIASAAPPRASPPPASSLTVSFASWRRSMISIKSVRNVLLPRNFETTTLPSHLAYVQHSMLSSTFGCAASVVSMQALLLSMGVGGGGGAGATAATASVLPIAATINWILKDGLGQLGGILFANRINTSFDSDPKRFRLAADAALAAGVVLESCTALFPSSFLLLASLANVSKNVAWISASATRASIHQSFCLERNLADVTAKAGSQSTCASLVGTVLGISSSYALVSSPVHCILLSVGFSALHLGFSYSALQQVQMNNLNVQRAWLCLVPAMASAGDSLCQLEFAALAGPREVAKWERILHFGKWGGRDGRANLVSPLAHLQLVQRFASQPWRYAFFPAPKMNSTLHVNANVERNLSPDELRACLADCHAADEDQHLLLVKPVAGSQHKHDIFLWFLKPASCTQVINGFLHAALVAKALNRGVDSAAAGGGGVAQRVRAAMHSEQAGARFCTALEQRGWDMKHVFMEERHEESRLEVGGL